MAAAGVTVSPLLVAACLASQGTTLPPPPGAPGDGGLDVPSEPVSLGPCPGKGTVTVSFDRGSAAASCWSASVDNRMGAPEVTLSGSPAGWPGLSVAVLFYESSSDGGRCGPVAGATLPLSSPCLFVSASYGEKSSAPEWRAFAGGGYTAGAAREAGATAAMGSLSVPAFGIQPGSTVSITFEPGATLVLDAPGHPQVAIEGSVTAPVP